MGSHSVNIEGDIHKTRISAKGEYFDRIKNNNHNNKFNMPKALNAFKNKEGCNLSGTMLLNKVPGNFHISSHAYNNVLR